MNKPTLKDRTPYLLLFLCLLTGSHVAQCACVGQTPDPGCVHFFMRTDAGFDAYIAATSPSQKAWFLSHFWELQSFSPSEDQVTSWYPSALVYVELYGVPPSSTLSQIHPEWILRDEYGNRLYLNYACSGGTCPQWAFDFSNPGYIQYRIEQQIIGATSKGYKGVFLDDVDMQISTSDGYGNPVIPVDRHTGVPMTPAAWEQYMANFVTQIRQAVPQVQIVHNVIWYAGSQPPGSDPYVRQQITAADYIILERGFGDINLNPHNMDSFLGFIDTVHSLGKSVIVQELAFDGDTGLAGYYLISSGLDGFANDAITPNNWWRAYDNNLGVPTGARYKWNGVYRRDYTHGVVLLNPYSSQTLTLTPGGTFVDTAGNAVTSVRLSGGQGSVLVNKCTFTVSPPAYVFNPFGGSQAFAVSTQAGCAWTAQSPARWITIAGASGSGSGNFTVTTGLNQSSAVQSSTINVTDQTLAVTQAGAIANSCLWLPNGTAVFLQARAQSYPVQIIAGPNGCNWNASSDQSWLTISNGNLSGSGTLNYGVEANDTGMSRTAHIAVSGQSITITQGSTNAEFSDVPPSASYFDAANLMFESGITNGCLLGATPQTRMYCPGDTVTRQEMAAFIVRSVTGTATPAIYNPIPYFEDVPDTNPFFPHIQKLMELGITTGCSQSLPARFCPTATIPRWQMAIFMVRARLALRGATFNTAATPYFADVPVNVEGSGVPFPFIQRSYEEHITAGCGANPLVYCPDALVTRGEVSSFIMRALLNETMVLSPAAPVLTGISPDALTVTAGSQITVVITGANTNFMTGDTVSVPSGMLTVSKVKVNSATSITATLGTNATTAEGPQSLVVHTGGQYLTLPLAIKVGTY